MCRTAAEICICFAQACKFQLRHLQLIAAGRLSTDGRSSEFDASQWKALHCVIMRRRASILHQYVKPAYIQKPTHLLTLNRHSPPCGNDKSWQHRTAVNIQYTIVCLSVCLSVCLFVCLSPSLPGHKN